MRKRTDQEGRSDEGGRNREREKRTRSVSEIRGEKLLRTAENERQQRERGLVGSPNKG